jgi:predicted RNA-binding Zn-ribbon protein involved in translation (DUF1610 family)
VGTPNECTPPKVQVGNQCCSQSDLQPGGACQSCAAGTTQTCAVTANAAGGYGVTCSCCAANQVTSTGLCCPAGQSPGGPNNTWCVAPPPITPPSQCCPQGAIYTPQPGEVYGLYDPATMTNCCPAANVTSNGQCCPGPVDPRDRNVCLPATAEKKSKGKTCAKGYVEMPDGACCAADRVSADRKTCITGCRPGETWRDGKCLPLTIVPVPAPTCGANSVWRDGQCRPVIVTPVPAPTCGANYVWRDGQCRPVIVTPVPAPTCGANYVWRDGQCRPVIVTPVPTPTCGANYVWRDGQCRPVTVTPVPTPNCGRGQIFRNRKCMTLFESKPTKLTTVPGPRPSAPYPRFTVAPKTLPPGRPLGGPKLGGPKLKLLFPF